MLSINTLRAILAAKKLKAQVGQEPVETAEVRRMYAFANTTDPRLIKLLKLVEQVRTERLRQGRFFTRRSG